MPATYTLSISNPAATGVNKNVVYTDATNGNALHLTIGNGSRFDMTIGGKSMGKHLLLLIPDNLMDADGASKLGVTSPWTLASFTPPPKPGGFFTFLLAPPAGGITLPKNRRLTIELTNFVAFQKGQGSPSVSYRFDDRPKDDLYAKALLLAMAQGTLDLQDLFGSSDPLVFSFSVNDTTLQKPMLTTPLPLLEDNPYISRNSVLPVISFQGIDQLLQTSWGVAKPPTFRFFFEYFSVQDGSPAVQDLTDCLKPDDVGYNPFTSAWNIDFSLDAQNPKTLNNDNWQITPLDYKQAASPAWLVQPNYDNNQQVFQPGDVLNLFISQIISVLPIDPDIKTLIYMQWYDFPGYKDGILAGTISKTRPIYLMDFGRKYTKVPAGCPMRLTWQSYGAVYGLVNIQKNTDPVNTQTLSFDGLEPVEIFAGDFTQTGDPAVCTYHFGIDIYNEIPNEHNLFKPIKISSKTETIQVVPPFESFTAAIHLDANGVPDKLDLQWKVDYTPDYFTLSCMDGPLDGTTNQYSLPLPAGASLPMTIVLTAVFTDPAFSCGKTLNLQLAPVKDPIKVRTGGNLSFALSPDKKTALCPAVESFFTFDAIHPPFGQTLKTYIMEAANRYFSYFAMSPDGSKLFSLAGYDRLMLNVVYWFDFTKQSASSFEVGQNPFDIAISPDGSIALAKNISDGTLSYFNPQSPPPVGQTAPCIPFGSNGNINVSRMPTCSFAFTPDSQRVFVTSVFDPQLYYFNTKTLPPQVTQLALDSNCSPTNVAMSPDGNKVVFGAQLFGESPKSNIYLFDAQNPPSNLQPTFVLEDTICNTAFSPDGKRVYMVGQNSLNWFDVDQPPPQKEVATLPLPSMESSAYNKVLVVPGGSFLIVYNPTSLWLFDPNNMPNVAPNSSTIGKAVTNLVQQDGTKFFANDFGDGTINTDGQISLLEFAYG